MFSADTETTGVDLRHGAKPFLITVFHEETWENTYWEFDVDPTTRQPIYEKDELEDLIIFFREAFLNKEEQIFQNPRFDVRVFNQLPGWDLGWDWSTTRDTLTAAHLLQSNQKRDLTTLALVYAGLNIGPYEAHAKECCKKARMIARNRLKHWRIAKKGLPEMPSVKGGEKQSAKDDQNKDSAWKNDLWLPKTICKHHPELLPDIERIARTSLSNLESWKQGDPVEEHPWWSVTVEYANMDTAATLPVYLEQVKQIEKRGLTRQYEERLRFLPVVYETESVGVSLSRDRLNELTERFIDESGRSGRICVEVAQRANIDLTLPKSGSNKSLEAVCFGVSSEDSEDGIARPGLDLPVVKRSKKTGKPSLDKHVLEAYETELLKEGTDQHTFVKELRSKRLRDTALSYAESYRRFWLPDGYIPDTSLAIGETLTSCESLNKRNKRLKPTSEFFVCRTVSGTQSRELTNQSNKWFRLYPSLNPTGTDTLRLSSSNPNEQNISKQGECNIRYAFGPLPGREWWSLDYDNLELRIPAYECEEPAMLELFENPTEPPYFGSYHLLIFSILHPDKYDHDDPMGLEKAKKKYKDTWYQWTKNGNFAELYGAIAKQDGWGTADRAFKVKGAQKIVAARLSKKAALNKHYIKYAEKYGYVYTLTDTEIDSEKGYPLSCTRTERGNILATVPLNYHVQGTACWVMMRAMILVSKYLKKFGPEYKIIANVHDEIVLDFPYKPKQGNRPIINGIKRIMESRGDYLKPQIKLTCGVDYHPNNWGEAV